MLKSTLFASFLLFAASSVCNAQQIDSLVVSNGSGDKAFLLDDVRRIDFSSDGMTVVSRTSNDQVFAFSDISKVFSVVLLLTFDLFQARLIHPFFYV